MTTLKINSMKKVRMLLAEESNIDNLVNYYHIVEWLFHHYKKVLNKAKQMEAKQLLIKIRMILIEKLSVA